MGSEVSGVERMTDFLLELRSEEIPARMQAGARTSLEKLFLDQMIAADIAVGSITIWSTPRRLALIARDLPLETQSGFEDLKGPRVGAPPQALEGFLRKTGLTEDNLVQMDGVWFARLNKPGRATVDVLADAIPAIIRAFPWPKSMRWGAASLSTESLRWVRPLSGIVALLGDDLVECEVGGVTSGYTTMGHRFHHSGEITIGNAADYATKLRAAHVIVDHAEREAIIRTGAAKAAAVAGLVLIDDEGLVIENAGLTEWPVPLLGRFDSEFLEVPPEVIQLTARINQKYFTCRDAAGKLANAFVCTANIAASDGGVGVVDGNRKVLAARLSDARFFWEQDRKKSLEQHAEKLSNIVFHEKLGTLSDKVERVAKLARWLVEEGIVGSSPKRGGGPAQLVEGHAPQSASSQPSAMLSVPLHHPVDGPPPRAGEDLANFAEQAARLCKADLVTEMVGEFPELQGLMGGYYARAEGLPDAVADAIRDHYKPVGQGDDVPSAPVTVAVSLADKLDTLFGFFAIDERPTGSKDPFALRRAGIGILALIQSNNLRIDLRFAFTEIGSVFIQRLDRAHLEDLSDVLIAAQGAMQSTTNLADVKVAAAREIWKAHEPFTEDQIRRSRILAAEVVLFLVERLKQQQREVGVRPDLISAGFASLGLENDLVSLLARVHALQAFVGTEDGTNLLAGYKRAANILKKEVVVPANAGTAGLIDATSVPGGQRSPVEPGTTNALSYTPELAEKALMDALSTAGPKVAAAVAAEDFAGAMAALASLRAPIDAFFDNVTVNDADPAKRTARLGLLAAFRDAVHSVADFSKIEG
jgi:glycyl-tRNA synthetase beta chain